MQFLQVWENKPCFHSIIKVASLFGFVQDRLKNCMNEPPYKIPIRWNI